MITSSEKSHNFASRMSKRQKVRSRQRGGFPDLQGVDACLKLDTSVYDTPGPSPS